MNREGNPQEWLYAAEKDQRAAQHLLDADDYEACAFHCQQAVEKLLKAIIVKQTGKRPVHTHDLRTLMDNISGIEIASEMRDKVSDIGSYYVGSRYPLDAVDPEIFIHPLAEKAVERMDEVFQWFLTKINFKSE
jgi:HEPN domain-containing protein